MMGTLSRLRTPLAHSRTVLALVTLLAVGNVVNAVRKGGDFDVLVEAGHRVVAASPLYADSKPGTGVTWPPFAGVFMVPFALLRDPTIAKLAWHAFSVVALLLALVWSSSALGRERSPQVSREDRSRTPLAPALIPLLAILVPLQTNFQQQNLNTVLLALVAGAMVSLRRSRDVTGGALVGVAAALKAFPGLLIVSLLADRAWLAAATAIAVTVLATLSPVFFYGAGEGVHQVRAWLTLNQHGGWPIEGSNQSLFAWVCRQFGYEGAAGNGHLYAASAPFPYWLAAAIALALVGVLLAVVARARRSPGEPTAERRPVHMAVTLAIAVLTSPIAWDHYWVLMFPAFFVLHDRARARWHRVVFWLCALLTSGFPRVSTGPGGLALPRELAVWTAGGLLLVVTVLVLMARSTAREAAGPPTGERVTAG